MGNRNIYKNDYLTPHFLDEVLFQIKDIWRMSSAQFHFYCICGYMLNTAYCAGKCTNKSVAIQADCMQDVFELIGTSWMMHLKSWFQIYFNDLATEIFGKYLWILNSFFTMLLAPDKKIILRCFFQLEVICLCAKF